MPLSDVDKAFLIAFVEEIIVSNPNVDVLDMAYTAGEILGLSKLYMDEIQE